MTTLHMSLDSLRGGDAEDVAQSVAMVVAVVNRWEAAHHAVHQRALAELSDLIDRANALRTSSPQSVHAVLDGAIESAFQALSRCAPAGPSSSALPHAGQTGDCCSGD